MPDIGSGFEPISSFEKASRYLLYVSGGSLLISLLILFLHLLVN